MQHSVAFQLTSSLLPSKNLNNAKIKYIKKQTKKDLRTDMLEKDYLFQRFLLGTDYHVCYKEYSGMENHPLGCPILLIEHFAFSESNHMHVIFPPMTKIIREVQNKSVQKM